MNGNVTTHFTNGTSTGRFTNVESAIGVAITAGVILCILCFMAIYLEIAKLLLGRNKNDMQPLEEAEGKNSE